MDPFEDLYKYIDYGAVIEKVIDKQTDFDGVEKYFHLITFNCKRKEVSDKSMFLYVIHESYMPDNTYKLYFSKLKNLSDKEGIRKIFAKYHINEIKDNDKIYIHKLRKYKFIYNGERLFKVDDVRKILSECNRITNSINS